MSFTIRLGAICSISACGASTGTAGVLVIGFAAGDIPKVPINLILLKSCQVVGVFYGAWSMRSPEQHDRNFGEILELFEAGRIDPLVGRCYPLEEYAQALRDLSERCAIGKVVLTVDGGEAA